MVSQTKLPSFHSSESSACFSEQPHTKGIAKGGVKNRNKGGCKRLFAFVHVCSRLLAFACVFASAFACVCRRLSAFVCVCLRLLAFACVPLCCAPLCVTLTHTHTHFQRFSLIFADSRPFLRKPSIWEVLIFRRKPQILAGIRRKTADWRLSPYLGAAIVRFESHSTMNARSMRTYFCIFWRAFLCTLNAETPEQAF